jgi:hypothetical protein
MKRKWEASAFLEHFSNKLNSLRRYDLRHCMVLADDFTLKALAPFSLIVVLQ